MKEIKNLINNSIKVNSENKNSFFFQSNKEEKDIKHKITFSTRQLKPSTKQDKNIIKKEADDENCSSQEDTNYKEQMKNMFKYFNVYWFDPNNSISYDEWKEGPFNKIELIIEKDAQKIISFFQEYSSIEEWIIITPGTKGEDLIKELYKFKCINSFIIYCFNPENHKNWAKKYDKIKGISTDSNDLCKSLLKINKKYLIPYFTYKIEIEKERNYVSDLNKIKENEDNKYAANSLKRENKLALLDANNGGNKYNIFCTKTYSYFKNELEEFDVNSEFLKETSEFVQIFFDISPPKKEEDKSEFVKELIKDSIIFKDFLKDITLISLYFSKYPYLYENLDYTTVENVIRTKQDEEEIKKMFFATFTIVKILSRKIKEHKSILEEEQELKILQVLCINEIKALFHPLPLLTMFYLPVNYLQDLDFCLKLFLMKVYRKFKDGNTFIKDIEIALDSSDRRIETFTKYFYMLIPDEENLITEEEQKILDESLKIKDFIIAGTNNFHNYIKLFQDKFQYNSLAFLSPEEIRTYLEKERTKNEYRKFKYYIIMPDDEAEKYYTDINLIACEFGLEIILIVNIASKNIFINKECLRFVLNVPIIIVENSSDIIHYLNQKNFSYGGLHDISLMMKKSKDLADYLNIDISNSIYQKTQEDLEEADNGMELMEEGDYDKRIFKNILRKTSGESQHMISNLTNNIFDAYRDHEATDLFLKKYCNFFGLSIYPEMLSFDISLVKSMLYAYCKEEQLTDEQKIKLSRGENIKRRGFYNIINEDLKSKSNYKIYKHLELIAEIIKLVKDKEICNFSGEVYRGTRFNDNLIAKLKKGKTLFLSTFWSTSRVQSKAIEFLTNRKGNIFITIKAKKFNVDIEKEKLATYDEKEILILPFTVFTIIDINKKFISGREVNTLFVEEVETDNPCTIRKMKNVDVNNLKYYNFLYKSEDDED